MPKLAFNSGFLASTTTFISLAPPKGAQEIGVGAPCGTLCMGLQNAHMLSLVLHTLNGLLDVAFLASRLTQSD